MLPKVDYVAHNLFFVCFFAILSILQILMRLYGEHNLESFGDRRFFFMDFSPIRFNTESGEEEL